MMGRVFTGTAVVLSAVCGMAAVPSSVQRAPNRSATDRPDALALHVLNRLTFGPRPGDVERVLKVGVDRWIEQQLDPESIADSSAQKALEGCALWTDSVPRAIRSLASIGPTLPTMAPHMVSGRLDSTLVKLNASLMQSRMLLLRIPHPVIPRDSLVKLTGTAAQLYEQTRQLLAGRLTRAEFSDQQLVEVMTDFWENHFSIDAQKLPLHGLIIHWDREVIRPHALGRFRTLLGAVAHSPEMLAYLDNASSSADSAYPTLTAYRSDSLTGARPAWRGGLNENYGRELQELHTLGVDGGYTQDDVIAAARAFTGWSHTFNPTPPDTSLLQRNFPDGVLPIPAFRFDSARHDAGAKVFLGHTLPAGRGVEDGEEVLDILARHPSTARLIARKLVVRFVSDDPPEALVARAADEFLRTDGDIRAVMRVIVMSPEFRSPAIFGAKTKSPTELVLSLRRAMNAPVDTLAQMIDLLIDLKQIPFGHLTPEGWPETATPWINAGSMLTRIGIASRVANDSLASIPTERWPGWKALVTQPFDRQMAGVISQLLHEQLSESTRTALAAARPPAAELHTARGREASLRELIALALASPEFQRR